MQSLPVYILNILKYPTEIPGKHHFFSFWAIPKRNSHIDWVCHQDTLILGSKNHHFPWFPYSFCWVKMNETNKTFMFLILCSINHIPINTSVWDSQTQICDSHISVLQKSPKTQSISLSIIYCSWENHLNKNTIPYIIP